MLLSVYTAVSAVHAIDAGGSPWCIIKATSCGQSWLIQELSPEDYWHQSRYVHVAQSPTTPLQLDEFASRSACHHLALVPVNPQAVVNYIKTFHMNRKIERNRLSFTNLST